MRLEPHDTLLLVVLLVPLPPVLAVVAWVYPGWWTMVVPGRVDQGSVHRLPGKATPARLGVITLESGHGVS